MKKGITIALIGCLIICMMWVQSCRKNKYETTPVSLTVPSGFPVPNLYANGGLTAEAVDLGRRLFYDGGFQKTEVFPAPVVISKLLLLYL
ncbi:MAG: hypothetical protein K2X48_08085 [Chitinophagaceae bacterium]|nr:hypothetical protein [Chitinophagaceae bacterium]